MTLHEIETSFVQVLNGKLHIDAYLAQPKESGRFPAIIVFQEIFGVNAHIRDVTERIAKAGYVAIAPAIFQRQAPRFETGYTPDDITLGRTYKAQTKAAELLGDTQATLKYLRSFSNVNSNAVGTIGFCFGGHVAYLAATLPDIKATASFYGAGIATLTPGGGPPTITNKIQGTVWAFFGDCDVSIPAIEVEQISDALRINQIPHKIFRYPADHGFFCDQRGSYHPASAADAWTQVLRLLRETLTEQ
jgi:carboxymethylenebutenolidase